ncbi:MAG: hypothetical protein APR54_02865 [Candidatus Cloacimonas sp. SDB]|nr:MAG: hypothetical protein APR54_02865 [Candidatus Cloacimonas sp. SDB]
MFMHSNQIRGENNAKKNPLVTIVGTLPPVKGISPYCLELIKSISKKTNCEFIGFNNIYPEFLYPGGTKITDEKDEPISVENCVIKNILTYYNPFTWIWAGLTIKGNIIHLQWWAPVLAPIYWTIIAICKLRGMKTILTIHNVQPHERQYLNTFLNKSVLQLADHFIVHSSKNKDSLSQLYHIPEETISIIPHGILEPCNIRGVTKHEAREYLDLPKNGKALLFFGNIREYKGLDDLLYAFASVRNEISNLTLIIAGKPWENWEKYEKIIVRNNLQSNIVKKLDFIQLSEVEYYFAASDAVILPYKFFDSQSGVGALAIPYKKPLIITDTGGLPDFVKNDIAIAKPNNPKDLARVIVNCLSNRTLLEQLSKDSEEIALSYKWDAIAQKTIELYLIQAGHKLQRFYKSDVR